VPDAVADSLVAHWLAERYGLGPVAELRPVARGAVGRIHRLVTASGIYAAKEYFWWRREEEQVSEVADFVDRCRAAGVVAAAYVRDESGRTVHDHPSTGRSWTVHDWVGGRVPPPTDFETARWLARQAAAMHRLAVPAGEYRDAHWYCRVQDDWTDLADRARSSGASWFGELVARLPELRELTRFVNEVPIGPTVMSHRDLKPENTLRDEGVDGSWSLLDWDNAGPHEPWREIGTMLLHHVGTGEEPAALAQEYRDAGGMEMPVDESVFASGVAIWLNFLRAQSRLALDETQDAEHRAFAQDRVPALIHGLPSLAALADAARVVHRGIR
jgi:Ser/Thr protein kinase RdoA (MazF antagonist)